MELSCFAPIGLLQCSAEDPISVPIYEAQLASFGEPGVAFDQSEGSRIEAMCFARALGMARMQAHLEQAASERLPDQMYWMLPRREREYGILPAPHATFAQRIAVLSERMRLPTGSSAFEIEEALTRLLGDDFVAYRPTPIDDAVVVPADIGDHPMNLQHPDVTRKLVKLAAPVAFVGVPRTVGFSVEDGPTLEVGDVVVFDPGKWGVADRVTISAIGGPEDAPTLTATFTYAHDAGAWGTTMPYPEWTSSKRHSLVVLRAAAARDPEKRRIVNEQMARMVRATSTWDVVEATEDESGTEGFKLGEPSLGIRTLLPVSL